MEHGRTEGMFSLLYCVLMQWSVRRIIYGRRTEKVSGAAALPKVGWKGMLALAFGILFFAGVFATVQGAEWLKAFDYSTLIGKFGTMKDPAKATFVGMGGVSARGGFIFALSLIPSVMLAIGVVDVLDHYGALSAAQN